MQSGDVVDGHGDGDPGYTFPDETFKVLPVPLRGIVQRVVCCISRRNRVWGFVGLSASSQWHICPRCAIDGLDVDRFGMTRLASLDVRISIKHRTRITPIST